MAADFNAGSIEGTLDLDSSPFHAGLDKARTEAAAFENKSVQAKADLDTSKVTEKTAETDVKLDKLGAKKVEPKADLNISEALAKYAILNKVLDSGGLGGKTTSFAGSASRIGMIASGLLSVIAAAGPAGIAMAGFGAASVAALGGVYMSLGLFAAAFKSAFGEIEKANKAGVTLTGWAGKAQAALKGLTDGWSKLVNSVKPQMFHLMTQAFSGVAAILPKLHPLLATTTEGISHVVDAVLQLTRMPIFDRFLKSLRQFMGGFLNGAGPVLANLLNIFMHAFIVLQPLMAMLGHGIERASQAAQNFAAGGGLEKFVRMAEKDIPPVMHLIFSLVSGLSHLIGGLAPLAGPALHFIGALVVAIGGLNLTPLAKGLGQALHALEPILSVAGKLLNVVLKPLGQFVGALAKGPLHALAQSLSQNLQPAFHALSVMLHALVGPLAAFAGSIANLINPTGARLISTLLVGLQSAVVQLAPSLGKLAVALESLIDTGLEMLIPILPTVTSMFTAVVQAVIPFINLAAKLLSFKPVAEIIIGIVAAMKAWAAVQWLLNVAMDANPIGIIVVALAALAVGVVMAYQHIKVFRDIVNAVFGFIKKFVPDSLHVMGAAVEWVVNFVRDHWQLLLGIITGPIGAAVIFLITHWAQIKQGFSDMISAVVNTVSSGIGNVVSWFESLPGKIAGLAGSMFNAGKTLMGAIFHGLESAASAVGGFASNIAGAIWNDLKTVLNNILPHSIGINKGPIHLTVPLFPYLAKGGITDGQTTFVAGDNPGGREAVIPLDKYDLPRRGESDRHAAQAHADNSQIIALLSAMLGHLAGKDNSGLAEAIANALDTHNTKMLRQLIQAGRAA